MSAAARHLSPDTLSPQQSSREGRTRGEGGGLHPQSSVTDEEAMRIAQSMVDIAAKQLYGLREFRTSEELIQKEICESESKLVRLFSKLLAVKARHPSRTLPPELQSLPRADQWLRIVGIEGSTAQVLANLTLQKMVDTPTRELRQIMYEAGATQEDVRRLTTALTNLKIVTEHQMNGFKSYDQRDLSWTSPGLSSATPPLYPRSTTTSPYAGNSPKFPSHVHTHHTMPRPSTSSLPCDAILGVDAGMIVMPAGDNISGRGDEGSSVFGGTSSDSCESPFMNSSDTSDRCNRQLSPPTSKGSSTVTGGGTMGRSGKFPTTPPPQKKNKLYPDQFQPLIKSRSHESHLAYKVNQSDVTPADVIKYIKKKPEKLTLGSSEAIMQRKRSTGTLDESSVGGGLTVRGASLSGQSSPLLNTNSSPFRSPQFKTAAEAQAAADMGGCNANQLSVPPVSPGSMSHINRTMMHSIQHRFQKKMVMSTCDLCRRHVFRGRICKCCKAKFHKDCASKAAPSCGLSEELVDLILKNLSVEDASPDYNTLTAGHHDQLLSTNHSSSSTSGSPSHPSSAKLRRRYQAAAFYPGSHHGNAPGGDYSSSATSSCNSSTPSSPAVAVGSVSSSNSSSAQPVTMPSSPATFHLQHQQRSRLRSSGGADTRFQFPDMAALDVNGSFTESGYTIGTMPTVSVDPVIDVVNTNTSNDSDKSDRTLIDSGSADFSTSMDGGGVSGLERLDSQDCDESQLKDLQRANSISVTLKEWDIPYDELILGELIGVGRFGEVHKGSWHGDVAIKLLLLDAAGPDYQSQLQAFKQEVAMLRKTRHENLVLFMGACMTPPRLAIITSLCKGQTLYTQLHVRRDKLPMNRTVIIATQIAQGMGYLHAKGIIHKDLKTKNIFLENGKVIITDFGLFSLTKLCHGSRKGRWLTIPPGWLCYLAPEIMRALRAGHQHDLDLPFTAASDVYAFGTVWYELLCGEWPFRKQPPEAIIWQVGKGMKQSLTNVQASRDVKDVLMQCWAYKTSDRLDFRELLKVLDRLPKKRLARSPSHPIQLSRSAESVF